MNAEVYEWYLENGEFDSEILKIMQLECFNKRLEPAVVITGNDLNRILNYDKRFGSKYLLSYMVKSLKGVMDDGVCEC